MAGGFGPFALGAIGGAITLLWFTNEGIDCGGLLLKCFGFLSKEDVKGIWTIAGWSFANRGKEFLVFVTRANGAFAPTVVTALEFCYPWIHRLTLSANGPWTRRSRFSSSPSWACGLSDGSHGWW